jgi:hypothetical protein
MKNLLLLFSIAFIGLQISTQKLQAQENADRLQLKCPTSTNQTVMNDIKDAWDIWLTFETVSSSTSGIATDGKYIYVSSFSTEIFYKYEMDGTFVEQFTIDGIVYVNCLTYDGEYFYGSEGHIEKGIYVLDLENKQLIKTIDLTLPSCNGIGHITYDPTLDGGDGGLWVGYWHELAAVDMFGEEIIENVFTEYGRPGIAGTAFDNITDSENPRLLCFTQTGESNLEITYYDINEQDTTMEEVLHVATDIPGPSGGSTNTVASGINTYINTDDRLILLGLIDCFPGNEMCFEYEIAKVQTYTKDISLRMLKSPISGNELTANEDIKIQVFNNGTEIQSNFDIQYTINSGTGLKGPFTQTVSSIDPGEVKTIVFDDKADLSLPDVEYNIEIIALLDNDENRKNDTLRKVIKNTVGVYCSASGGSGNNAEYIGKVELGDNMVNTSSADHYANYSDNADLFGYLTPNTSTNLKITIGGHPYNGDIGAVWIDWNNDSDFDDNYEKVFVSDLGQGPYTTSITPPSSALKDTKLRMRIRLSYYASAADEPVPCGANSFGEVEDYTVIVSDAVLSAPSNLQMETLENHNIKLTWNEVSVKGLIGYNIYKSYNYGEYDSIINVSEANFTYELTANGVYRFYVKALYNEGVSVPTNYVQIIVDDFTGINNTNESNFSIFPNPFTNSTIIAFDNPNNCNYSLNIYSSTGKLVQKINNIQGNKFVINRNNLPAGIYFIVLKGDKTYKEKVIIK